MELPPCMPGKPTHNKAETLSTKFFTAKGLPLNKTATIGLPSL